MAAVGWVRGKCRLRAATGDTRVARMPRGMAERSVNEEREGRKNTTTGCDEKSRGREKEREKKNESRVKRVKTKGVAKQEKETRQRYTEGSNLVGEDCFHSRVQIEKERENRDSKAC